jgi:transketolase
VVEEHVKSGGLAQMISEDILTRSIYLDFFKSLCALQYPDKAYGSQAYHQQLSGLDADSIGSLLRNFN